MDDKIFYQSVYVIVFILLLVVSFAGLFAHIEVNPIFNLIDGYYPCGYQTKQQIVLYATVLSILIMFGSYILMSFLWSEE
jgi:hypothetical protein